MNNKDYRINNIYYMLAYAFRFDKLIEKNKFLGSFEEFENVYDLLSFMLFTFINKMIKRGFYKDYKLTTEITSVARGKINFGQSIKENTLINRKLVCSFDDFSDNIYLNKIIKTTLFYLIKSNKMKKENKQKIKKIYLYFDDIDILDNRTIRWNQIILNKSNRRYQVIINICYLILKELIITQENGENRYRDFFEDEKLSVIYERFVREYYKKHYPKLNPSIKSMKWNIDEGYPMIDFLPTMITDINLYHENKVLIIDTKFYANILEKGRYDKKIISRNNWNQLFAYISNYSYNSDKKVSGMLLYAQTDEEIANNSVTSVMGYKMSIRVLDLRRDFNSISYELNKIADDFIAE